MRLASTPSEGEGSIRESLSERIEQGEGLGRWSFFRIEEGGFGSPMARSPEVRRVDTEDVEVHRAPIRITRFWGAVFFYSASLSEWNAGHPE